MDLTFRNAQEEDLPYLIEMLADDELGAYRENISGPLSPSYFSAFKSIDTDPNNELVVVEGNGEIVGLLQLTFIPHLTHCGSWRCQVEGVRIHKNHRGKGLGTAFFEWAIARAKERQCYIFQLTTNKKRPDAIRFYENLGFKASHEGFKMYLGKP